MTKRVRTKGSIESIKAGFETFYRQYNRLPTASEVDNLSYLPSSRYIQKRYGGLEKIRVQLGFPDPHLGKGLFRSTIASKVGKRGRANEQKFEKMLREKFGEVFVHTERIFDNTKNRVDFFVYCLDGNFGIDVFYTDTLRSLQSNVNIKMKKYTHFPSTLYLVSMNEDIHQGDLDLFVTSKVKPLPEFASLVTLETIESILVNKRAYPDPLTALDK